MSLVVQKYGGSSVGRCREHQAGRPADRGHPQERVRTSCVVVSAMGDTTDELIDLAQQVSPLPPARELDMLLTAGERISMAVLAMAIANLGSEARSFTGSQAGVITDSAHGKARIIDVTPGRIQDRAGRGPHRDRGRFPGRQPGHQGHHHAGPRRLRHHRGRAGRRAGRGRLRDIHRRGRRLHRRPPDRAERPPDRRRSRSEEMLEMAASGAKVLHLRCVEYARRYRRAGPRPVVVQPARGHLGPGSTRPGARPVTKGKQMEQPIISGVAHDRSEAKITVVGVPDQAGQGRGDLRGGGQPPRSTST